MPWLTPRPQRNIHCYRIPPLSFMKPLQQSVCLISTSLRSHRSLAVKSIYLFTSGGD
ncbi:uncharacterized protein BDZ83DRAFT_610889 [Colletotrichum acutatum]|uniref:Uncharacterized protein n=1 Tax=Glomerella acutata TaxID=27357 RepID=A0AAD8UX66_GLOAC|nr:uncharacterized protein BDZ83DRAFT_610889 [Colletotrichum acutatum]KAK1728005.1 hypothetical protein BDZ83DRAFT_610889 [Colletotrichum acutatum]